MSLRRFLARAQATLQSLSREERQRRRVLADERKHKAVLASPLPELRRGEAVDVARIDEALYAIRTGEFPVVLAEIVAEDRPGIYSYPEPIGPKLPTVDEQFAAFEADPLAAPLPGAPAKDNAVFVEQLSISRRGLDDRLVDDLEMTGSWDRGFLAALARGER